jgi:ParB-like chromosome segregation protein Spo0J
VLKMLERGQLTEGHARAVLAVPDHEGRRALARKIVQKGMSVRAASAPRAGQARRRSSAGSRRSSIPLWSRARRRPQTESPASPAGLSQPARDLFRRRDELEELVEALERRHRSPVSPGGPPRLNR